MLTGNADEGNYLHHEQEVNKTGKGKCRVSQSLLTDGANDLRPSPKPVTCTTFRTSSSLSQEPSSALLPIAEGLSHTIKSLVLFI